MTELALEHIYKIYDNNVTAVSDFNLHINDKNSLYLSVLPAAGNRRRSG